MSALELERTLARLYTDAPFRRAFLQDPTRALAPLDLTLAEQSDLAGLDRAGPLMAAASYNAKQTRRQRNSQGLGSRFSRRIRAAARRLGLPL